MATSFTTPYRDSRVDVASPRRRGRPIVIATVTSPRLEQTHGQRHQAPKVGSSRHIHICLPKSCYLASLSENRISRPASPALAALPTHLPSINTPPPFPQQARTSRSWHPRVEGIGPAPTLSSASVAATRAHHVPMSCHAHRLCAHCVIAMHCSLNCSTPPLCPKNRHGS
jgi:hypothetical protein